MLQADSDDHHSANAVWDDHHSERRLGGSRPDQLVAVAFDRAGMSVTHGVVLDALVTVLVQGRGGGQRRCCRSRLTAVVDCVGGKCVRFLNKGKRGRRTGVRLHCTLSVARMLHQADLDMTTTQRTQVDGTGMTTTQRTQNGMTTTASAGLGGSRPDQLVAAGFDRAGMSVTYEVVVALVTVLVQGRGINKEREFCDPAVAGRVSPATRL